MDTATFATLAGALATIATPTVPITIRARRIKTIEKERVQATKAPKLEISRIRFTRNEPFLISALALHERGIPDNERDDRKDIIGWIKEVEIQTKEGRCDLKDFFGSRVSETNGGKP